MEFKKARSKRNFDMAFILFLKLRIWKDKRKTKTYPKASTARIKWTNRRRR